MLEEELIIDKPKFSYSEIKNNFEMINKFK